MGGSVLDPTYAKSRRPRLRFTHLATDAKIEVRTNDPGECRTSPLRVGACTISIEAAGFNRSNQRHCARHWRRSPGGCSNEARFPIAWPSHFAVGDQNLALIPPLLPYPYNIDNTLDK